MRRSYNRAYAHFIWATWERQHTIDSRVRDLVYPAIITECNKQKCCVEAIGGVEDHVHLIVHLSSIASFSSLMKAVKGSSSHLVTEVYPSLFFKWQGGYGVETISPEALPNAIRYVQDQQRRHKSKHIEECWETIDVDDEEECGDLA